MLAREQTEQHIRGPAQASQTSVPADIVASGTVVQVTDDDLDGLREGIVTPDGYGVDGNRDGILDAEQRQVAGIRLLNDGSRYSDFGALVVTGDLSLHGVNLIPADSDGAIPVNLADGSTVLTQLPTGLANTFAGALSFEVGGLAAGSTAEALIYLPVGYSGAGQPLSQAEGNSFLLLLRREPPACTVWVAHQSTVWWSWRFSYRPVHQTGGSPMASVAIHGHRHSFLLTAVSQTRLSGDSLMQLLDEKAMG